MLNQFEHREGLITEPAKSWIMPIGSVKEPYIELGGHVYTKPPNGVGRLLGHHFTWRSMVNKQVELQKLKAGRTLNTLWGYRRAKTKTKVHVVKALVFPHLTYPVIPLHTGSDAQIGKLQSVQNDSIRFAFNVGWYDFISSEKLHNRFRYKFQPLNQVLHWRARKTWDKIRAGTGADPEQYRILTENLEPESVEQYDPFFPSSLVLSNGPEPPPLYTYKPSGNGRRNGRRCSRPLAPRVPS